MNAVSDQYYPVHSTWSSKDLFEFCDGYFYELVDENLHSYQTMLQAAPCACRKQNEELIQGSVDYDQSYQHKE
ncbi:hypothetical protein JCM30795_03110 [Agathobaculum butyriciproducens]